MNNQHVISILIKAREQVSETMDKAHGSLMKWIGAAEAADADNNRLSRSFNNLGNSLNRATDNARGLGLALQGMQIAAVIKFAQALITALLSLGGALTAVASSAVQAGAALGGALVAGLAQAIPAVGLLVAAFQRLGAVLDAMKLQQQAQQQAFRDSTQAQERHRASTDSLRAAKERLQQAQQRVIDTSKELTRARRDSRRELEDLILAEKRAELASRSASLSQRESRNALAGAISKGSFSDIERLQLGVDESRLGGREATVGSRRATQDLGRFKSEGSQNVLGAQKNLAQARREVADATRDLARAHEDAATAAEHQVSAAIGLDYALSKLTASERKLYERMIALRDDVKKNFRPITDIIVDSFTRGVDRASRLLGDKDILKGFRGLAREQAGLVDDLTKFLSGSRGKGFLAFTLEEAKKNTPEISRALRGILRIIMAISEAAAPAFRKMVRLFADWTVQSAKALENNKGLEKFFDRGLEHLRSWVRLGGAIIRLFAALAGAGGAKSGKDAIDDFTKTIQNATKWVNHHRQQVAKFFEDSIKSAAVIGKLLVAIGKAMADVFNPGQLEDMGAFLINVVIPALRNTVEIMGILTRGIAILLNIPIVRELAQWVATIFFLIKGITLLRIAVLSFIQTIGAFAYANPLLAAIIAIIAAIVILDHKFHFLAPTLEIVKRAMQDAGEWILKAAKNVMEFLAPAIEVLTKVVKAYASVWLWAFEHVTLPILKIAASAFKTYFGIIFDVVKGFIEFWRKIFKGDFKGALNVALDTVKSVFGRMRDFISNVMKDIFGVITDIAGGIADAFSQIPNVFVGVLNIVIDIINAATKLINKITPGKIEVAGVTIFPGYPDIDQIAHIQGAPQGPKYASRNATPVDKRARGGRVGGPMGAGDVIPALLSPGEFVVTGHGEALIERLTGLPNVLDMIGAVQKPHYAGKRIPGGMASGGRPSAGAVNAADAGVIEDTADRVLKKWNTMWDGIEDRAIQGNRRLGRIFDRMRSSFRDDVENMHKRAKTEFEDIAAAGKTSFGKLEEYISSSMHDGALAVFGGLKWIEGATNSSLSDLGGKKIDFNLTRPKKRAGGGLIGSWGEAGPDDQLALLGRGEAVLNRHQQPFVEQALGMAHAMGMSPYGNLDSLFGGVTTPHYAARGGRIPRFAGGGQVPGGGRIVTVPWDPAEEINSRILPIVRNFVRRYHADITDAYDRDRSAGHQSPGHNITGTAVDMIPGPGGNWDLLERGLAQLVRQGYKVLYGSNGIGTPYPNHGRNLHAHVEFGSANGAIPVLDKIGRPRIEGGGALGKIGQLVLDRVRGRANSRLERAFDSVTGFGAGKYKGGVLSRGQVANVINRAMSIVGVPSKLQGAWRSMALARAWQESTFNPNAVNNWDSNALKGDPSRGLFQTIGSTFSANALPGHRSIFNPLDNAIAAFRYMLSTYGGGNWSRALSGMRARAGIGYARGGFAAGGRPAFRAPGFSFNAAGLDKAIDEVTGTLDALFKKGAWKKLTAALRKLLDEDTGLFAQLAARTEDLSREVSQRVGRARAGLDRRLRRRKGGPASDVDIAELELSGSRETEQLLRGQRADLRAALPSERQIGNLRRQAQNAKGKKKDELKRRLELMRAARNAILGQLEENESALIDAVDQVRENQEALEEAQKQAIRDRVDKATTGADRGRNWIERVRRVLTSSGQSGAANSRSLFDSLIAVTQAQVTELGKALEDARATGDQDLISSIQDQIDDLNASIVDYSAQAFQAAIDAVSKSTTTKLGFLDARSRIAELQAQITGGDPTGSLKSIAEERRSVLEQQRVGLQALLDEAKRTNNADQIDALTQQMYDNEIALLENTVQLEDLNGVGSTQTWTSSAFQLFRQAIFNGNGGLLPQYSIPGMLAATGNMSSSPYSSVSTVPGTGGVYPVSGGGDTYLNITSPVEVADPTTFASRFAWEYKNR